MKSSSLILALAAGYFANASILEWRQSSNWTVGQTVDTASGPVSGHAAKNNSAVSEYLGIPYGQAPIGNLRFAAPVKFTGKEPLSGASFGPNCPVRSSNGSSLPTPQQIDAANATVAGIVTLSVLSSTGTDSEDCLSLNVWTKPQTGETKKAVLVWLYGGGFSSGSSSVPGYNGANIAGQEDVVVVSFNYRLSILGFPGNPNSTANLALLDQRLAVEWVRDNIEKFGGDPSRITLFGQSAGAASIDFYSYAWTKDPIVAGLIPESGNVIGWGLPNSKGLAATAWFNVTTTLGCGTASSDSATVLECMRGKNYSDILGAIPPTTGTAGILGYFGPTVDGEVVFANYSSRTPAKVPMLIGNNNYEGGLFRTQFALNGLFYPDNFWDAFNLQAFTCPTGIRANLSTAAGIPTWRYRYMGVFPNLAVSDDAGTYHVAEVPMLFNTAQNSPAASPEQVSIGNYMRGAWAAFAKDPQKGLTNYGWPLYNTSQDTLVRIAYENITGANLINPYRYDADCHLVNVSSVDATVEIPEIPNLGANVTPTGNGTSSTPTATGSATGIGSGTASAKPTSSGNAGGRIQAGVYLGMVGVMAAALINYCKMISPTHLVHSVVFRVALYRHNGKILLSFCSCTPGLNSGNRIIQGPLTDEVSITSSKVVALVIEDENGWFYNTVIEIGTPPQSFKSAIDIDWSDTFVPSLFCVHQECTYHRLYDHTQSSSFQRNGTAVQMHYAGFYTSGFASVDTLRLGNMTIMNQAFEEATRLRPVPMWDDFFDSAIGLSRLQVDDAESSLRATNVFHNMIQQNLLDRNLFSLRLSDSRSGASGELMFGDVNADLFVHPLVTFPVTTAYSSPAQYVGEDRLANVFLQSGWQIAASAISLTTLPSGTVEQPSFSLVGYLAAFSTIYPYIMVPQTIRNSILQALGADNGVVPCDTVDSLPFLAVGLGDNISSSPFVLQPWDFIRKVPKWEFGVDRDDYECEVQIAGYDELVDAVKFIVLGGAFLSRWYSVFDFDNATVSLAALKKEE
ncbi:hypothetical protein VTL71DRAFT_482 [Oculimacula yallundae]|uniref:Peptidase A1 domain-containing protein n=1 Tax=Oculimacula yallundae TaxID=86028 RepID=A0ABR4D0A8_9HELO